MKKLVRKTVLSLALVVAPAVEGTEYQNAEDTAPAAVGEIDSTTQQRLPDRTEYDYTIDFRSERGGLEGLWLRLLCARVDEDGNGNVADQLRLILNYSLPIL